MKFKTVPAVESGEEAEDYCTISGILLFINFIISLIIYPPYYFRKG